MALSGDDLMRLGPAAKRQILEKLGKAALRGEGAAGGKYHSRKTARRMPNGKERVFDSEREARRYDELCLMLRSGQISDLRLQENFTITEGYVKPSGETVRPQVYKLDFSYFLADGRRVYEDVKGHRTQVYVNKKKCVEQKFGIEITEV